MSGLKSSTSGSLAAFDRMEQKVVAMEAEAEAVGQVCKFILCLDVVEKLVGHLLNYTAGTAWFVLCPSVVLLGLQICICCVCLHASAAAEHTWLLCAAPQHNHTARHQTLCLWV